MFAQSSSRRQKHNENEQPGVRNADKRNTLRQEYGLKCIKNTPRSYAGIYSMFAQSTSKYKIKNTFRASSQGLVT